MLFGFYSSWVTPVTSQKVYIAVRNFWPKYLLPVSEDPNINLLKCPISAPLHEFQGQMASALTASAVKHDGGGFPATAGTVQW
jgi:hypothetical protein